MVATMSIYLDTGGSDNSPANEDDIDGLGPPNLRFKLADNSTIDTNNKLVIPAAGTNYSYWKQCYLYCDAADGNTMDNLKTYADGSNSFGTGVDVQIGLQFPEKNSGSSAGYDAAAGSGDSGEELTTHTDITTKASIFNYSSGSPLSGPSISEGTGEIDAATETSNYIVLQMDVADTASPGELPVDETFTIQYDEY